MGKYFVNYSLAQGRHKPYYVDNIFFKCLLILKMIETVWNFQFPRIQWQTVERLYSVTFRES